MAGDVKLLSAVIRNCHPCQHEIQWIKTRKLKEISGTLTRLADKVKATALEGKTKAKN